MNQNQTNPIDSLQQELLPPQPVSKQEAEKNRFHLSLVSCLTVFLLNLLLLFGLIPVGQTPFFAGPSLALAAATDDDCDDDDIVDDDDECDDDECDDDDCDDDDDDNNDDDNDRWEGAILSSPSTLTGTWTLSIRGNRVFTFTATADTRFRPNTPAAYTVGQWVEVRGERQRDGTVLAERVRVDDYEAGEIVVRLADARYADDIAQKFELTRTAVMTSANIYLFVTHSSRRPFDRDRDRGGDRDRDDDDDDERVTAERIAAEEGVIWAEANYVHSVPEDDGYKTWGWGGASEPDEYTGQSALQQIRWMPASRTYRGEGAVVAVLDTGIYTAHEKFEGKLLLPGLDVISDDNDPSEVGNGLAWGHGTHVAGVIAAMAPAAKILPVRVLDENGRGNTFLLAYAIEWVSQQTGVDVINLSLGTEFNSKILRDVIADAVERGIVVVAAVGNNGTQDVVQYPAHYPHVLGVTALDYNLSKASFANYGEDWVDIAAPGVSIMSTMINEQGAGYATWSGTSMATAFVSGAAALLVGKLQAQPRLFVSIASHLQDTGVDIDAVNPPEYGGKIGRLLDVSAALDVTEVLMYMPQALR